MIEYINDPALWALVVGAPVAVTAIVRGQKARGRLKRENEQLQDAHAEYERAQSANTQASLEDARNHAEEVMKGALKSAMRTLQGLASEQQVAIFAAEKKFGDQEILQDLLEIDHMNAQFGRRAQSIAVLCDGWLGRQRTNASVHDVIRSAKGRIRHYTRVKILSQTNYAVVSRVVEPVALVLAELLDNATSYSAPDAPIDISIRAVPQGVCIIIDDAGVSMNDEERARAAELLSGERQVGVTQLGSPPQFGFPVIGVLAARYGFKVSIDSASPYGGVRAVVLLPEELLTSMPESQEGPVSEEPVPRLTVARPEPVPSRHAAPAADEDVVPELGGRTPNGLPRRYRKRAVFSPPAGGAEPAPGRPSEEIASIMGAFQRGTAAGRNAGANREGEVS